MVGVHIGAGTIMIMSVVGIGVRFRVGSVSVSVSAISAISAIAAIATKMSEVSTVSMVSASVVSTVSLEVNVIAGGSTVFVR
jgi:hypothetical protein